MNIVKHSPLQRALAVSLCLLAASGCNSVPKRDPAFAAVMPQQARPIPASPGSIYKSGGGMALYADIRAHRVGDILTVRLEEKTDATKSAETDLDQSTTINTTNPTILGNAFGFDLPGGTKSNYTLANSIDSSKEFEADAGSSQSNSLSGDITVTVVEVFGNDNLRVQGEKLININQGYEHIRFSGIVRAVDIDASNSVSSTRVADATMIYAGQGDLANTNTMGMLGRFFLSVVWPF